MKNLNNLITRYENLEQVRKKCENLLHHIVILPLDAVHVLLNLDNYDLKSSIYKTDLMSHSSQDIPTGGVTSTNSTIAMVVKRLTASVQRLFASSMVTSTAVTTSKYKEKIFNLEDLLAATYLIFTLCACPGNAHVPGHVHRQLDQVVKEGVRGRQEHCQTRQDCHGL